MIIINIIITLSPSVDAENIGLWSGQHIADNKDLTVEADPYLSSFILLQVLLKFSQDETRGSLALLREVSAISQFSYKGSAQEVIVINDLTFSHGQVVWQRGLVTILRGVPSKNLGEDNQ